MQEEGLDDWNIAGTLEDVAKASGSEARVKRRTANDVAWLLLSG